MKYAILVIPAIFCAALNSTSHASLVQVRDAPGGTDPFGAPDGYLLAGTGSPINGTVNGGAFQTLGVGAFGLEANWGSGFQPLITYCIEPTSSISFGLNPADLVGAPYQTAALTDAGFTAQEAAWLGILWAYAYALSLTSPLYAAAFQAVIWEFKQDDPVHSFTSGNFDLDFNQAYTLDVINTAEGWLNNILGGTWTDSVALIALTSADSQDFITTPVPAPGAATALLVGLGLMRRARTRRA